MADPIRLFQIGQRGVDVVNKPQDLDESELASGQNIEVATSAGGGALDQRPGMTKINAVAMSGAAVMVMDVASQLLTDLTPWLYAGFYTGATHNWRASSDGTNWVNDDTLAKPFSDNANITLYAKNFPKVVTVGKRIYYVDGALAIQVHQFDGTTDLIVSTIPPAPSVSLTTPAAPIPVYEHDTTGATTYTYVFVATAGASYSAGSATGSVTTIVTLTSGNFVSFDLSSTTPVAGANNYDVYRTVGGATQGKIGAIPITSGTFTSGNGSGVTGSTWVTPSNPGLFYGGNVDNGVTYSYKVVKTNGSAHSAVSPAATNTHGPTNLSGTLYMQIESGGNPGTFDVYRTAGGATQGKIASGVSGVILVIDNGLVADGSTAPSTASGLDSSLAYSFTDAALAGDSSSPPGSASGSTAGNALAILDMITDGTSIYFAVMDFNSSDPTVDGRILQYFPITNSWIQIGAAFPIASGHGSPANLELFDGAISYGTYIGVTSGNTSYLTGTNNPLPGGGIPEIHTTSASQVTCSMAIFNGDLYVGYAFLAAGTAALLVKRVEVATWSTSLTAGATAAKNAYTSLYVFNGRLYAGWTSGGGATAANVYSTPDGVTWTLEQAFATSDVPCQMVEFNGSLYLVLGTTGIAYNTTSSIWQRTALGVWTKVDDPSDSLAGCIGVLYK